MTAFNEFGDVVGAETDDATHVTSVLPGGMFHISTLEIASTGIRAITLEGGFIINSGGWSAVYDDLTIVPQTTPVPLPAALLLLASALSGLALLRGRTKR